VPFSTNASFAVDALVAVYFALSRSQVPGLIHRASHAQSSG
jgi:RNA-binding protein YlmH